MAISANGDIQDRKTGKFLRVFRGKNSYLVASVEGILMNVHQLVANAWNLNDDEKTNKTVDHIDGNRMNNC